MRTLETKAVVTEDGRLTIEMATDIPPGEHRVVLMIEEESELLDTPKPKLKFKVMNWHNWPSDATFRREEIYDDNRD